MNDDSTYLNLTGNSRLTDESHGWGPWMNITWHPWIYRIVRITLGCIFLWSGIAKSYDPVSFATIIQAYGLLPSGLTLPAAIVLAALEVITALGLLLDIRGSLGIISGLLVLFITILSYGILLGLDVDCGCFGPEDPEAKAFHGLRTALHRDGIMVIGIIYLYAWRHVHGVTPVRIRYFLITCQKWIRRKK